MERAYANDLGTRLIRCKKFNWLDGMLIRDTKNILKPSRLINYFENKWFSNNWSGQSIHENMNRFIPDVTDPATVGCLLSLIRKLYNNPYLYVESSWQDDQKHFWFVNNEYKTFKALEEVETLVIALESLP